MKRRTTKNLSNALGTLGLLSLLCLAACGQKAQDSSASMSSEAPMAAGIIDGQEVAANDLIAQTTVIVYNTATSGLCTGTLIKENLVLTAAHCAMGAGPGDLEVQFGTKFNDPKNQNRQVIGGVVTENYQKLMSSNERPPAKDWQDMAVIKIEDTALPAGYKAATLLFGTKVLPKTETVMLAGYGLNEIKPSSNSRSGYTGDGAGILRETAVTLLNADYSNSEILVATTNGKGACHGDSGGPAYLVRNGKITVVGVTSRADSETGAVECNGNTVYTSVPAMQDFIKKAAVFLESKDFQKGGIGYL